MCFHQSRLYPLSALEKNPLSQTSDGSLIPCRTYFPSPQIWTAQHPNLEKIIFWWLNQNYKWFKILFAAALLSVNNFRNEKKNGITATGYSLFRQLQHITFWPLEGFILWRPKNLVTSVLSYVRTWRWYSGSIRKRT